MNRNSFSSTPPTTTTASLFVPLQPREGRELTNGNEPNRTAETATVAEFNKLLNDVDSTKVKNAANKLERKIDSINERLFFYAKPTSSSSNQTEYRNSKLYINYQQAYGIRYDPNKIRRSFNYKVAEQADADVTAAAVVVQENEEDAAAAAATTTESVVVVVNEPEDLNVDDAAVTEAEIMPATIETTAEQTTEMDEQQNVDIPAEMSPPPPLVTADENQTMTTTTTTSNIMKPSRVQEALQFLNQKVRNLFKYGLMRPQDLQYLNLKLPQEQSGNGGGQRFLNIFNVIKFDNIPCASHKEPLTPLNGTCYSQVECDQLGGVAVDDCAGGFGVCCVCTMKCVSFLH